MDVRHQDRSLATSPLATSQADTNQADTNQPDTSQPDTNQPDTSQSAISHQDIITVRPDHTTDTLQKLPNYVGISEATAGATGISMNIVIIPPGAAAEPHFHKGFETAIYLLKGRVETLYGEGLAKSVINETGDFIFIPASVPHQPRNLSDTDAAIALVARNDPNEQESVERYDPQRATSPQD